MRHVDGDQDIGLLLLEADERQDQGREIGRRGGGGGGGVGGLRGDEGVGGDRFAVPGSQLLLVRGKVDLEEREDALEMRELCLGRVPDLDGLGVLADQILEVDRQGAAVALEPLAVGFDPLGDVEDDGGEAVLVEVDFLVVGDLADRAGGVVRGGSK